MRARNLKPKLFKNELLGSAEPLITIRFEGLWCSADREGRLEDRPLRLCAEVFPYRRAVTEKKVDAWLDWLHEHGFITRYEVEGRRFIQVLSFLKHNRPHSKEQPSEIPPLSSNQHLPRSVLAPTKVDPESGKGSGKHALNPESPFLNPESSLREYAREPGQDRSAEHRPGPDPRAVFERVQASYPKGTYGQQNWILAEREIGFRLDEGVSPEQLVEAAAKYCEQQTAMRKAGTEFVRSPEKFYGQGFWKGPFPLPKVTGGSSLSIDELKLKYPEAASG